MMKHVLLVASIIVLILSIQNYVNAMEWNTDRPGSDFSNFDLPAANPKLCQDACAANPKCKAWTYVKPNTVQGPRPRCWLKYAVPQARSNNCCVSGVKGAGQQYTKQTRCNRYANTAVSQNTENIRLRCGFTGPRWQSNYNNHYNWCLNVSKSYADEETRLRIEALRKCQGQRPRSNIGKIFNYPKIRGYRLDWCRRWATDCGKGAADAFCRLKGYSRAKSWKLDPNIGHRSPTYVIETGQICDQSFCGGFKFIVCE